MADVSRKVSLIFDADISRAKQQIDSLASSINKLMDKSMRITGITGLDKDLQEAAKNAAQLQVQLQKAVNVKTGKLDLTRFNDSLRESGMTLDKYQQSFSKVGSVGQQAFTELARSIATAEIPLRRSSKLLDNFAVTMKNTVKWQLSSSLMHGFLSSIQSAMSYAQHLNQNLTDIRIVSGQSADEMARFAEQANKSAKELSTTTNQYAQAALIFYQQGLGDKAVKERTDAVIKMANVTGEAAKDVSSYMTAIWNNFDDGSKSIEYYADVITKLGAATAASSEEIAGGLEKFAAVGNTIGLSYEYATAMLTTIIDKTRQSEDVVGTALKTILARIQGLNLGETLDDGTTLNKYSAALASVGVQIKDTSGQLRDMDFILNDLGAKWQTLSKDTQVALAQVVGGVRQYNQIISLMDNWDAFEMNLDIAFNAEGELNKQAEIYAESWEAAQNRVQAALESIYSALIDDTFFINMNNMFADLLDIVKQFIDGVGGVSGLLTGMGSILLTVFGSQITASLKNLTNNIRMLTKTGQEELISIQKHAQTLLNKQDYGKGVGAQGVKSAYESEARAQLALLNNAKKLSEEEQAIANILMQQHHVRVDEQVALGNQLNELEKIEQRQIGIFDSAKDKLTDMLISEGDSSSLKHSFSRIDSISQEIILLQDDFGSLSAAIDGAFGTGEGGASVAAQRLLDNLNNIKVSSPEAKQALEEFKNAMKQAGTDATAQSQAFNNLELALGEMGQTISDNKKQVLDLFNNMRQAAQGNEELTRAINLAEQAYRNYINTSEQVQNTKQELITANGRVIASEKAVQAVLKASGAVYLSTQQSIVAVAQVASTLGSLFNTFKGLRESIKEGDVSFGQILTTIGFLVPQILSLIGNFKNLTMTTYGAIASGKIFAGTKMAEAAAANVASGAMVGFGTALKTALPIYGLIAIAITGLIALFNSLIKMLNEPTAYEKHLEEMKKLNEELEKNKEQSKEATETVADLYEKMADYTSALQALNQLTEGTKAWNEQLTSTKNLANILLDSMPILADIVANPQKYGMVGKIRDKDGNFTQEVLDLAFNTQRDQESLTIYSNAFNQREIARTREVEAEHGAVLRGIEYTNIGNENYVGASGAYERDIWTLLTPLIPELIKLYSPEMTSDAQLVSGATLLEAIKNSPAYFEDGTYTEQGRILVDTLIFGAQSSNLPGTYDPAYSTVNDKLSALSGLDVGSNGVITVNEDATPEQIDAIITTTMDTIVDTEATGFLNVLAKDYSNMIEPVVTNQIGEEGGQTYFDQAGELASLYLGFNSEQTEGNETFVRALGNYIANQVDEAYNRGDYSNLTSEDFAKVFRIEGAVYDSKTDTLTYNNPNAGQEGEEDTITINNARDTYAARAEVEKLGYINGDYTMAASLMGYDDSALVGRLFENKGDLSGFTVGEVDYLNSTGLSSYLPDTVTPTLEEIKSRELSERNYGVAETIVNTPSSELPEPISNLFQNSEILSSLSDEELALLTGQNYSDDNGLLQAAKAIRTIESVDLSDIADDLERGIAPAKIYEGMAGNMSEIAEVAQKLQDGETIDEKEYGLLESAGINLSNIYRSGTIPGKYEGIVDISSVLDTMLQTQKLGELFDLETDEELTLDTKKLILEYLGYNLVNYTTEEIDNIFSQVSDDTLKYIDTFHIGEEVANFIGILGFGAEEYLGEYSDKYTTAMAQAQAKLDEIDWDILLTYAGKNGITSQEDYNTAVTNLNRQTGINELVANADSWIKQIGSIINREDFDSLIQGEEFGDSLKNLMEALSLILGFEVDTDFIKKNWDIIDNLIDGDQSSRTMSVLHNFGITQGYLTGETAVETASSDYTTYGAQLDYANLQEATQVKAGDIYTQGALAILDSFDVQEGFQGVNRNLFDIALQDANLWDPTGGPDGKGAIADEELFKKWLDESGIVQFTTTDEEGNVIELEIPKVLDEELIAAGYDTVEEIITLFTNAMIAGAGEYDIDSSGFDKVVRDVYSGLDLANQEANGIKIWATKDQMEIGANALNNAYTSGGIRGLSQVATWLEDAGAKAPQLAAALANIDWSASNAFDLASAALSDAGLNADKYTEALDSVISATQVAIEALTTLAEAIGLFSSSTDLADQIRNGEAFGEEGYKLLEQVYGPEVARAAVTRQADGQYIATSGNNEFLAMGLEQNAISGFEEVRKNNQGFLDSAYMMNDSWTALDASWLEYLANSTADYGFTDEQKHSMLQYGELKSDEERRRWAEQMDESMAQRRMDWSSIQQQATTDATRNVEESTEMMADAETRIPRENMEAEWAAEGFSEEDIELIDKYGDSIQELAKDSEYLSEELIENAEAADEIASELMRYEKGLQKAADSTKDWSKSLRENTKGSDEYIKTTEEMSEALEDIYDLDDGALDGLDLDWERLNEDMVKMSEGTAEEAAAAYQDGIDAINDAAVLEAGLVPDLDMTQFESGLSDSLVSMNEWQNLVYDALNNIEAGGIIDGPLLSSLESMLNACYSTATEAQNALTRMGVDGQVVVAEEPITNTTPTNDIRASLVDNGYLSVPVVAADGSVSEGPKIPIQGVKYTAVPSVNTSEGAIQNVGFKIVPGTGKTNVTRKAGGRAKSSMGSRPARSGGGGGGGGGGGSRAPRAERKSSTDKDRYRTVKNQLEDLTDSYDKVSTAADRAFGETKLELLKQQEKAIQDLISKQREYIDEINEYYDIDRQAVEEVSSRLGFEVQFDENGTITNWDEIQDKMIEEYNSHINDKGEVIGMDEEAWSEYEKEWERVMELFNQYDETQDLRKEALQQLQDYANQLYDLQLQEVTYVVEIKIDATDDALEILDYMLGRIEDDAWAAAEAIAYMGQKAAEIQLQNNTYTEGIRGILMNHTRDLVDSEGNIVNSASLTVEDVEGFMSGQEAAIKKIMALNEEFTDEEVQQLREYNSSLIEMNETLNDLRNEVFDKVLDSFEAFNDEMDRSIDKIDHLSSLTENYANIIDIVGQKNLEISNALMDSISQATVDQATNRVEATREKMLTIQEEIARAEEALADAKSKGLEEDAKLWEDTLKEMNDSLDEAEEEFLQSWEDALTAAAEAFEASMNRAISSFSDALAGPLLGSLEQLEEMFDRQNTIADRYLPDYEKIYELNKLNRDITNSIDDTDNIRAKQELAALQEEINKLEEDGVQVSEYQVENLRRRYELKLAELALTESQNAKSEVRMSRNADGDWSYVYVADEEQVAEAEQNYEDKLFAMQQANAEYINNLNDMIIQMETELTAKLEEIANDETLSQEEKMARMNETIAFYQEQMGYYMDELGLVLGENQILYEQDWTKYSELTGYKISANEAYVDHFNETALSLLTGYETMEEFQRAFNDAIGHPDSGGLLYDLDNAFKTWEANTEEVFNSAGTSMEDFRDVVEDSVNDIVENSEEATESIEEMGDNVVSTFDEITSAVQNWSNVYSETIDSILSRNEMLAKSFNELLKAWAGFEEATEVEEGTAPGEDEEIDTGDLEGGDGQKEEDKGKIQDGDAVYIAEGTPGIADWAEGPGRRYYAFYRNNAGKRSVGSGVWYVTVDPKNKKWDGYIGRIHEKYLRKFDTGGYTGSWGSEGRVAMLHEKELVLNKQDTSNLLAAVGMIRDISKIIDLNAYASSYGNITSTPNVVDNTGTLEQQVHITAEFPNATDKDEILSAFDDIINLASQYANRR